MVGRCGPTELVASSPSRIAAAVLARWRGQRGYLLAPVLVPEEVRGDEDKAKLWQEALRADWQKHGYVRALRDGVEVRLDAEWPAEAPRELLLVVDRLSLDDRGRLVDGAEQAARASHEYGGHGVVVVQCAAGDEQGERLVFSSSRSCPHCGFAVEEQQIGRAHV